MEHDAPTALHFQAVAWRRVAGRPKKARNLVGAWNDVEFISFGKVSFVHDRHGDFVAAKTTTW
jgi:hypothetical protein